MKRFKFELLQFRLLGQALTCHPRNCTTVCLISRLDSTLNSEIYGLFSCDFSRRAGQRNFLIWIVAEHPVTGELLI